MRLPNFIVAGFPKCGSTSLHYYLDEHPDIFLTKQKELHHFTYDLLKKMEGGKDDAESQKFWVKTTKDYKKHYKEVKNERAIGDMSPSYANYAETIPKIKKTLGEDVKVVILLRDPIKRAYSNYMHLVREGRETLDFYDALMAEDERRTKRYSDFWLYTFNSTYYEKIRRMKENFREVLVVTFEAFIDDPEKGIREIYEFLEVDPEFVPLNLHTQFNEGGVYRENPITKFIFRQSKLKTFIKKLIPISPRLKKAKLKVTKKFKEETPEIPARAEDYLIKLFQDDVLKLKEEYGVRTEFWNPKFQLKSVDV